MDSEKTTTQTANLQSEPNDGVQPHPELLMAARHGDRERLKRLLGKVAPASQPPVAMPAREVVVHVEEVDCILHTVDDDGAVTPAEAVTVAWDSILHVVASSGDEPEFLQSATVIYGEASHLLNAGNKKGDTPLHCAARAGRVTMVSHLLDLARGKDDGDAAARAAARKQNKKGETALHEAVRLNSKEMVDVLLSADPELARVVPADGDSPLYLAVSLGRGDIALQLHQKDKALSYAGPDGKNALHAAVQKGKEMSAMILEWNKDLIKQADRHRGSTPLHVAASWGHHDVIRLLLDNDTSAAYQPDHDGSFPIHVAAFDGQVKAVSLLLDHLDKRKRRNLKDCAELRDARGWSFLHVAVQEQRQSVVAYACKLGNLAPAVLNMQDDDGNTALHLAVQVGNLWIFNLLMKRRQVELNLTNNKGETPVDISWIEKPVGVYFGLNPRVKIYRLLKDADAKEGNHRWDLFHKQHNKKLVEEDEAKKLTESTQTIGIGSVLIATVAFAAAFAPPGGYRADDHRPGGAPTLAGRYAFDVFIIANTLAFICAGLSIISLTYAGVAAVDIRTRMISFVFSAMFMASSARSLGVAFAFGMYVVLAPVARTTAIAACVITGLALVDVAWFLWVVAAGEVMLLKRLGIARAWWRLPCAMLATLLMQFWPYLVIVVVVLYSKVRGVH
ncbi:hypothetical protein E2562_037833 [Oryza meyeriana var. granulata]|uniref:PGG domain-containing protein n=1 Tax=Oryza meyeriana var. granulata TaxID=110450 RepID=A0A6G1DU13_9ORYZ|nr:hypothetical protein E2562_037833 [Oryza meyeriana var. granulata]